MADKLKKQLNEVTDALQTAEIAEEVKTILAEVLPFSLGESSDKRHRFQEEVIEIISGIFGKLETGLSKAAEEERLKCEEATSCMPARESAASEAAADLEATKAELQRLKLALAQTAIAFKDAKHSLAGAEEAKIAHGRKSKEAETKKVHCEAAFADLQILKKVSPKDDTESSTKLDELVKLLKKYKFDESILIAVPAALAKAPDARGEFDHMAIDQLAAEISKMIAEQDSIISAAKPGEEQCEASVMQAQEVLSNARANQKSAAAKYIATSKQQARCEEAVSAAKNAVLNITKSVNRLKKGIEAAEVEVELFQQGPKDTFNTLRNRVSPVPVIEPLADPLATEGQVIETEGIEIPAIPVC